MASNDENSWSDPEVDDLIRNISEEELLSYGNDGDHDFHAGRNGDTKATKSQKARTNKGNITISWKAEGNTIPKNSG